MKKAIAALFIIFSCFINAGSAQLVAKMELKQPIEGLCGNQDVYVPLPMYKNQKSAVCPVSKGEITKRLNAEVSWLKDSANYNDKGMVRLIINCKGEMLQCTMDNITRNADLDDQIVAVFNSLGKWKPGTINGKTVNTAKLWSFKIVNGKIEID